MEEALREHLLADGAITALVARRIAWNARPQGSGLPAICVHRITGRRDNHMTGRSGLVETLIQVDCWAGGYLETLTLRDAVIAALDGLTLHPFQRAFVESERSSLEKGDAPQGSARTVDFHRTSLDVRVWHTED